MKQYVCDGGGEEDGAGGEGPNPECGGDGHHGVVPGAGEGAGEVAVGVDADGDRLTGLRRAMGGHCGGAVPVECRPPGAGRVPGAGGAQEYPVVSAAG